MKRYLIHPLHLQYDFSASELSKPDSIMSTDLMTDLKQIFGERNFEQKLSRFLEFGDIKPSLHWQYIYIIAEIRIAFIVGTYYTALVASCTLGERILNHIFLTLRDYYEFPERFSKVKKKISSNNWDMLINLISSWGVFNDNITKDFNELRDIRHHYIHYNLINKPDLKTQSLHAIRLIFSIMEEQFGLNKDYIFKIGNYYYVKMNYAEDPYVKNFVINNAVLVGYKHSIIFDIEQHVFPQVFDDGMLYKECDKHVLTDEEYLNFREKYLKTNPTVIQDSRYTLIRTLPLYPLYF